MNDKTKIERIKSLSVSMVNFYMLLDNLQKEYRFLEFEFSKILAEVLREENKK